MSAPTDHTPPEPAPPAGSAVSPVSTMTEDASAQALSEALRSSFQIVKILMIGLVVLFFCSGVFVVEPNEVAVVLRFGRPIGTGPERLLRPGWHWALPYPIDEKVRIPIGQSHTVTSTAGWYATTPEMEAQNQEPAERGSLSPEVDGYTLTADGNIIHARATLKYRISDPLAYTFNFTNVTQILTNVANNALFYASARVKADAALYKDKTGFRDLVLGRVQQKIEELQLGIQLEPSDVETKPPVDVRRAFEAVNAAEQERSKVMSDAKGYHDEVTRKAVGEARAIVGGGLISSNKLVQVVSADARSFSAQLPRYRENPQLWRSRMLTTTMNRVLTNAEEKFFLPDRVDGRPRELRLQLSREPIKKEGKEQP